MTRQTEHNFFTKFKMPLLVCLVIFHFSNSTQAADANNPVKSGTHQTKRIKRLSNETIASTTVDGTVHLFTEEVRYPAEALGLFSLKSFYNKRVSPKSKTVRGWMRPSFVTDIDSMKQKMGLEIYFILMWQEDDRRVNWSLEQKMEEGVAFSFSPSVLK